MSSSSVSGIVTTPLRHYVHKFILIYFSDLALYTRLSFTWLAVQDNDGE
jgi:hypothetical protein